MSPRRNLKVASFDGGGIRTFSQLGMMREIMHRVRWDKYPNDHNRVVLPCEHFDLIGGSDTGGLVAILFVKLRMSVEEVIAEFSVIVDQVYVKDLEPIDRTTRLKSCIEQLLIKRGLTIDARLESDIHPEGCMGFSLAALRANVSNKVYLRTYPARRQPPSAITIVDAILATCASQPDFAHTTFGTGYNRKEYVGAGVGANNPVRHVIAEAQSYFGGEPSISLLLSLGSGYRGIMSLPHNGSSDDALHHLAVDIMADCEQKAQEVRQQIGRTGVYFRFSVEQGMQKDKHTLAEELGWISAQTDSYLSTQETLEQLDKCVERLKAPTADITLNQLNRLSGLPPGYVEVHAVAIQPDFSECQISQFKGSEKKATQPDKSYLDVLCGTSLQGASHSVQKLPVDTENLVVTTQEDETPLPGNESAGEPTPTQDPAPIPAERPTIWAETVSSSRTSRSWSTYYEPDQADSCLDKGFPASPLQERESCHNQDSFQVKTPEEVATQADSVELVVLTIKHELALTYAEVGNDSKAELLQAAVFEGRKLWLGLDHPDTLTAMVSLASTYYRQKRYQEAEDLYILSLEGWKTRQETESPDARLAIRNLGMIYREQGRHSNDEGLLNSRSIIECDIGGLLPVALPISRDVVRLPGPEPEAPTPELVCDISETLTRDSVASTTETLQADISTDKDEKHEAEKRASLVAMASLASSYHQKKQYSEAEPLYLEALAGWSSLLGLEHSEAITVMHNLGSMYYEQGLHSKAVPYQVSVLEARTTRLGPTHLETLAAMACLASTYYAQSRYLDAEPLFISILEGWDAQIGVDHLDALEAMTSLASIRHRTKHYQRAEALYIKVLDSRRSQLGAEHSDTLTTMHNLALMYHEQGRFKEAEDLQLKVLKGRKVHLGSEDLATLTAMHTLAMTYYKQGRHLEAEQLQTTVLYGRKAQLGNTALATLTAMYSLASTYHKQGQYTKAEDLRLKVFESRKHQLGLEHPDTLIAMAKLASTYYSQGRHLDASKLQVKDLELCTKLYGCDSEQVAVCAHNLGLSYWHLRRFIAAKELAIVAAKAYKKLFGAQDSRFKAATKLLELLNEPIHDKQWYYSLL
ncbi:hypothetical protein M408DRAFT_327421 [Serendipita vermifera MAFF 305830]|uniref:PNPLA domain-containing protein n=1 Tax=Serendipita vermifera MAFF 305830 TaxID=933852 RepID=A0A0C3B2U8_SERVB|nr:hypothetical protein M408DRAFT_327421 [Serendipita vermifera MAFF 305830]